MKKRLQKGRKFSILAEVFGVAILHVVPEISVTRLDLVGIYELLKLQNGSVERGRVDGISRRIAQMSGDLV